MALRNSLEDTFKVSLFMLIFCWATNSQYLYAKDIPESDKSINIILNDWTSQLVLAKVTGQIFTSMGYKVSYIRKSSNEQWGALKLGLAHVQIEVWEGTMAKMFKRMVEAKAIVDAGSHDAKTREEWWYPLYVEEQCPGLPDWMALKDCAAIFATTSSMPKGRYLGGPWEKPDAARVRALGLNIKVENVKNGDELWVELDKAYRTKTPILLFNWTPNWVESQYEGRFVEFPDYDPACETDPKWGVNKIFLHDCGNPKNGWLKKAAWQGMSNTWPCAYETLQSINFTNVMITELSALVDVEHLSHENAANKWLKNNEKQWRDWIPEHCNTNTPI